MRTSVRADTASILFAAALLLLAAVGRACASERAPIEFRIPAGPLAEVLDRFGEQSGLQVVYEYAWVANKRSQGVAGRMSASRALERCLGGSGVEWRFVNESTVVLRPPAPAAVDPLVSLGSRRDVTDLGDLNVVEDSRHRILNEPSGASFGFEMPLESTPRSVSVASAETIDLFGLSSVEDLVRVAPGVFTTTRWGIQGSVDVRNVPADTYFRGMKRLNLQGHGRTVLGAMETIEVVRGPASPIYGMGKIGGYTNMVPKSARAATGSYLLEPQGFVQARSGSFDRSEVSVGLGGPLPLESRQGGYYVFGLIEDSGSYVEHVPVEQQVLQASINMNEFVGPFRLETGVNLQRSRTSGALVNRFTQDVADTGRYIRGDPLVDLDVNGNGRIGYLEMFERSPIEGDVSAANRALAQYFPWPVDAAGRPLALDEFPSVAGIPQSLYEYLVEHPEADPDGWLRAQGPGGPQPISGYVPIGFALDPRTVGFDELDPRRAGAFEKELEADFVTAYFDLIDDSNPNATIKNQLFFDSMDQYKLSEQPFSQEQDVRVIEDKLTVMRRLTAPGRPLMVRALGSVNLRHVSAEGAVSVGDYGTHRTDAMSGTGLPPPNATFASPFVAPDVDADGIPWTSRYATKSLEAGAGALFDVAFPNETSLLVGLRYDWSRAENVDYAGTLDPTSGTRDDPAVFRAADERARGRDSALSWSVSWSHPITPGLRPYATIAEASLALDENNNKYENVVIESGHIGKARLKEVGLKADLRPANAVFTLAAYEQSRSGVSADDPYDVLDAHVSSTVTRGFESELRWAASERLLLAFYALHQKTRYTPNVGARIMVDARALGFMDVVDANGNVVYPAEALLYGGRVFLVLPPGVDSYDEKQGNPETQIGMHGLLELRHGIGFTFSANYFSKAYSGRLKLVELPDALVLGTGLYVERPTWHVKLDVLNLLDERYFRARTGDTLGDTIVSAMPGRSWQATFRMRF